MPAPPLEPITRRSLSDEVTVRLRDAILNGRYRPGDHLRQVELALSLGVSRTPLRHALTQLRDEGVLVEGSQGFQVASPGTADVLDLILAFARVEGVCARLAAERASRNWISRLERAARTAPLRPSVDPRDNPTEFHDMVAASTGNRSLVLLRPSPLVLAELASIDVIGLASHPDTAVARAEHLAIWQAIHDRDAELADQLTVRHFLDGRRRLAEAAGLP